MPELRLTEEEENQVLAAAEAGKGSALTADEATAALNSALNEAIKEIDEAEAEAEALEAEAESLEAPAPEKISTGYEGTEKESTGYEGTAEGEPEA